MLILFNPLLFQVVVDPSLSPFIPTITIVCGGRHLSRMQPFSLIPNLHRVRTFFIFVSMTAPSGKAKSSSVGNAATFPKREGSDLFRRQKPPPFPRGKAVTSSVDNADTFPEREGKDLFRRQCRHLPRKGRLFAERDQYYFRENYRDFYTV